MNRRTRHTDSEEVARRLEGGLSQRRAAQLDEHLRACPACRDQVTAMQELTELVGRIDPELDDVDLVAPVNRLIDARPAAAVSAVTPARLRFARWGAGATAAAALAAALLLALWPAGVEHREFRAKTSGASAFPEDQWVGLELFQLTHTGDAAPVRGPLARGAALIVTYTNVAPEPYAYVMVFAVDQAGEVYWHHPAHLDPAGDPGAAACGHGAGKLLPEAVEHALPPGALAIYGLFGRTPLRVSQVEAAVRTLRQRGEWNAHAPVRLPFAQTAQHILTTTVQP